jgi:hypothetical protein
MITQKQFDEFVKHYNWEVLKYSDYRVGQAFINYFPAVIRTADGGEVDDSAKLFYNTSNEECWTIIRKLIK